MSRALLIPLLFTMVACTEPPAPTREWTPADHAQPRRADPSRSVPSSPRVNRGGPERAATALYQVSCAGCHGRGGQGDGPQRAPVMQIPDFTSVEWQASRTDAQLTHAIEAGRGMMPAFGDRVPAQGVAALVAHVRRFRATEAPPTEAVPANAPEAPAEAAPAEAAEAAPAP